MIKKDIMKYAGAWGNMNDEVANEIKESIRKLRKKSTKELLKYSRKNGLR